MTILTVALPLWVADHTRAPTWTVSPLIAVNTVLAMALQVRFSRGSVDLAGAAKAGRLAGLALAVAAVAFAVSGRLGAGAAVAALLVAVVAHTCGEMWQAASGWGISYELSPPTTRASHLSFFNLGVAVQGIVGPALLTVGVVDHEVAGWCALAAVFAVTGLAVTACARHATPLRTTSMPVHADHTGVP
jgi:MFS family permease